MDGRLKSLEDNLVIQKEMIKVLEKTVKKLENDKVDLAEALDTKEQKIHNLKVNDLKECPNGCHRYSKSIDEIFRAGSKHKEKLLCLKSIAENQKKRISSLQGEKGKLFEQVQQLEEDVEIGQNIVKKQSSEKEKLYF